METTRDAHNEYHGLADWKSGGYFNVEGLTGWLDIDEHVLFFINTKEGKNMAQNFHELLCPAE